MKTKDLEALCGKTVCAYVRRSKFYFSVVGILEPDACPDQFCLWTAGRNDQESAYVLIRAAAVDLIDDGLCEIPSLCFR